MDPKTENAKDSVFWALCIMGSFAILSSTLSKNPVLKPFATSLGTPADWTGVVAAASTIPGILVSLPAASLSDIFGRKKFLLIAGLIFASAPFLYLLITVWWQLILIRFYHGFATAIFVPVAESSVAELFPSKRGERISLFSSTTYIGRLIAPFLGGYILLITNSSFHTLYLAVAVAGVTALIMTLPILFGKKQTAMTRNYGAEETMKRLYRGWGTVVKSRGVLIVCFIQACVYYTYGATEYYLSGYLKEVIGFDFFLTSIITGSLIAVPIFVKPYMGRISDKTGRRMPIVAGVVVSALPLLVVPFVSEFALLLFLSLIYGVGFAAVTASTTALVSELVSKELTGTSIGFLDTMMDVGQSVGPIISGLIYATSFQYAGVFPSLALVLIFSCVVFAFSGVAKTRRVLTP